MKDDDDFVEALGCLISPGAVALFDNTSLHIHYRWTRRLKLQRVFQSLLIIKAKNIRHQSETYP